MKVKITRGKDTRRPVAIISHSGALILPFSDRRAGDQNNCVLRDGRVELNGSGFVGGLGGYSEDEKVYAGDTVEITF